MQSLPLFHRIAGQPVIVLGEGPAAEPKRRLVERAGGVVVDEVGQGLARGARLAFVALDDQAVSEEAARQLKAQGLLVNVVDRPDLCDFTTPSILDRDPVLVAIGTGGASAGLAKQLRLRLESLLPPTLGALAESLQAAREKLRARWPSPADRRQALDGALAPGGALDPLRGESADAVDGWIDDAETGNSPGQAVITLRSADPDDLTLREARLLGSADVLLAEPGVPQAILERARADALRRLLPCEDDLPGGLVVELRLG
ncbi:siroheme synthase [Altererythrobacter sp. CC-YST694]|uniref:precorrin-2 dehydrogenase/sirohydrochlorin ferrochelatase family protein n=1 Tax=Altererythrobacter sp. CC-YST694 TaxID=2755038 RepID=UPI001D005ECA|nr:bifunctional precorrin-2 dehydrogenase/sirohydrochlorin ferrochelatase [Altererythrobacter sp. CC-YST694]MCB5423990.1 siroheme synthase [Altererythrobacter sp. CC-YST694]